MSLINDALKRATQAQPAAPLPGETSPPMQPVTHRPTRSMPAYFVPVLLLTLSLSCWFFVKAWGTRRPDLIRSSLDAISTSVAAREPEPPPASAPLDTPPVGTNSPVPASTNDVPPPPQPPKPPAPPFKLQGIFYRPSRPAALVNTKTVYVGDKVGAAKVKAITQESVTLEIGGQTLVLTLP